MALSSCVEIRCLILVQECHWSSFTWIFISLILVRVLIFIFCRFWVKDWNRSSDACIFTYAIGARALSSFGDLFSEVWILMHVDLHLVDLGIRLIFVLGWGRSSFALIFTLISVRAAIFGPGTPSRTLEAPIPRLPHPKQQPGTGCRVSGPGYPIAFTKTDTNTWSRCIKRARSGGNGSVLPMLPRLTTSRSSATNPAECPGHR